MQSLNSGSESRLTFPSKGRTTDTAQFDSLSQCRGPRFRFLTLLLTLLLLIAILLGAVCVTEIKLQQDRLRTAAFHELREMGFQSSISTGPGKATSVALVATRPPPSDRDLHKLSQLLEDWTRSHDLGFSPALNIELVDLRGTGAAEEVITELRRKFPDAEIRY